VAAVSGRRGLRRAARDVEGRMRVARITTGSWGRVGATRQGREVGGGTRWWLGGRAEVELGRVRVYLGQIWWVFEQFSHVGLNVC
jgi:hypothetical protein